MIKVVCPDCKDERLKYEVVTVAPEDRKYEIRCPVCGKIFMVYGKDTEGPASCPPVV
jgi:ribosomal protein S27E